LPRFSNQMLRYQRMPEGLVHEIGLPAHRALPDAYVTAHHLRDLLNATSLDQLLAWSREPGLLPRVPAGPDRGKGWDRISDQALEDFARDRDIDVRFSAEAELTRRENARGRSRSNLPSGHFYDQGRTAPRIRKRPMGDISWCVAGCGAKAIRRSTRLPEKSWSGT
jgi:hypothetical protein